MDHVLLSAITAVQVNCDPQATCADDGGWLSLIAVQSTLGCGGTVACGWMIYNIMILMCVW